jgi:exosortase
VGLALLGCALLVQVFAHVLGLEAIPLATLPFVLCGAVLVLWGRATLRVAAFPLLFLLFAVPIPDAITLPASAHVQRVSTSAAAFTLTTAGMPVAQTGNRLDTPTLSVEVADVCSGFKKLTALVAFSLLFGHAFGAGWGRRAALLAATYPIALVANCVRICALVGIGSRWGQHALEAAHDGAEFGVLLLAFALFVAFGRGIGCRDLKIRL